MTHSSSLKGVLNPRGSSTHRSGLLLLALLGFTILASVAAGRASAITDSEELARFGGPGTAAGQLNFPNSIASDPTTGHVYVLGLGGGNNRIDEFTPWGNFVKAFGWDVAPGAVNEQQELRVRAAAGQFNLSYEGSTTPDLAFDAPGAENEGPGSVEAALNNLPSIGGAGASVSVSEVPGTANGTSPYVYVIAFKGSLAGKDVPQLSAGGGGVPLSGGNPSTALEVRTRADGSPAGTGLESCTAESGCQKGLSGSGPGEVGGRSAVTIAVDPGGDIYVRENGADNRVQKFSSSGRFILMFGGGVDKTTGENLCTAASGDECGVGASGTGPGEFVNGGALGIAVGPEGTVFVADAERVQRFNPEGEFEASLPVPNETIRALAIAPGGDVLYVTFASKAGELVPAKEGVRKLDASSGASRGTLEVKRPTAIADLATDPAGNLYVADEGFSEDSIHSHPESVLQFNAKGEPLSPASCCAPSEPFKIYGIGTNGAGDLYLTNISSGGIQSFVRSFGPAPVMFEGPPPLSPTISTQFASSVERDGATVVAQINPHFWSDARYYVQYGTGECSQGECQTERPLPPGSLLGSRAVDAPVQTAGVFLEGLTPGTTYHYRFVAQSGGGGPVFGDEATFTTFSLPFARRSCANDVFRFGFSAALPDCRAYEMVSPVDKAGGDIKVLPDALEYSTALNQSSTDGNGFTYSSYRAFANPKAAPYATQIMASRQAGSGWENQGISPPQGFNSAELYGLNANFDNEYWAFSSDLCQGWLLVAAEPPLAPGGSENNIDLYRRHGCGETDYEAVAPRVFGPELQGTSADGSKAVLRINKNQEVSETYYASEGTLHPICILPNGTLSTRYCSAGTDPELSTSSPSVSEMGHRAILTHAISADGSRVYWTESGATLNEVRNNGGAGVIFLRENPGEEQSAVSGGECTEPEKACTVKVSETKSTKASRFLGASRDGSKALFEVVEGPAAGKLYEFELGQGTRELAGKSLGVAGMGEDLARVYFVSEEVLVGTSGAKAGRPNLYLDEEGSRTFIATLSDLDAKGSGAAPTNVNPWPVYHVARASTDGSSLAFISNQSLTGYDNTDAASQIPCGVTEGSRTGVCDSEVYLYKAGTNAPVCVSCNPSGARPQGRLVERLANDGSLRPLAASLPLADNQLYLPRGLSTDGSHLFFNSYDALVPRDTNGKEDVYEWEQGGAQQQCEEANAELFVEASGGCLSLISSGESPEDSAVLDANADGQDVFFTTNASLLPQDPGLIDVYDARKGGGFPQPSRAAACEGEACQGPLSPPNDPTPASSAFEGAGNVVEKSGRKHRKKKHSHKSKTKKRAAKHNRGGRK